DLPGQSGGARSVCQVRAGGNRRLSWLIRESGIAWQVRNAPVTANGRRLEIGPLRNTFSARKEIVIAPMQRSALPYVHRLRNVDQVRVQPYTASEPRLQIEVLRLLGPAQVEVCTTWKPRQVEGAEHWTSTPDCLHVSIAQPGEIVIDF